VRWQEWQGCIKPYFSIGEAENLAQTTPAKCLETRGIVALPVSQGEAA
jgi:hypothetical protein